MNDVEIYYNYHLDRSAENTDNSNFQSLPSSCLMQAKLNDGKVLQGMYNLKLPLQYFNKKGFYSIYIQPKRVKSKIIDVSSLAAYPDVRGIVVSSEGKNEFQTDNALVGYRIEYLDADGETPLDYYRIVTSSFKAEPVVQYPTNSNDKSTTYRYNSNSSLMFLTLTPSSAPNFKPNSMPFIGKAGQEINFVNTKFNPIMIDLELVEHDVETITTMLEGSKIRDLEHGLITTLTVDNEIYHQSEVYSVKDSYTGKTVKEVNERKDSIDYTQTLESINS